MTIIHRTVLYILLGFLGASLVIPGMLGMFRPGTGSDWLVAETIDARNHLRATSAMIAGLGIIALWACFDLENSRQLVIALGVVMAVLVLARIYSAAVDGIPGTSSLIYLAVEALLAAVFLAWPPPA